jgi:enamine deaminase RidA (YjgF/YER057c/UK114 family)
MTLHSINPSTLSTQATYSQVVIATGSKLVFIAGQEPEDVHGKSVGVGDFAVQASQVFTNLGHALSAASASPRDVARITIYVVGYRRELLPLIETERIALFGEHKPVDTIIGVAALARPEFLIEVDAIAILGD